MEHLSLPQDLHLAGIHVAAFPNGIQEAFTGLMKTLGEGHEYYGVSWMDDNDRVMYYAMATESFPGEGASHQYESLTIEKGNYQAETVHDWMSKTECIKDVFHRLTAGSKPVKSRPCVEWYKSDKEMICMVKA